MDIRKFTQRSVEAIQGAQSIAIEHNNQQGAYAIAAEQPQRDNPLKHVEDTIEQNDNNFDGLINNTPVSYTHLDVYKRQQTRRPTMNNSVNGSTTIFPLSRRSGSLLLPAARSSSFPFSKTLCLSLIHIYYALRDYGADGQIGREATPEEYVSRITAVFHEVKRVLTPEGTCWLNIADTYCGTGSKADHQDPKYPKGRNGQQVAFNHLV